MAAVALGAEPASELPLKPGSSFDLWRTAAKATFVAVLCLAIVAAGLYAWRQRLRLQTGAAPPGAIGVDVEWARRASPRTTLLVVRWQGKRYLLAENGTATHVIDTRSVEELRT